MAHLYNDMLRDLVSPWLKQRRRKFTDEQWSKMMSDLQTSSILYVGNLSFFTREEQIHHFFSTIGPVKRVIMGLHRVEKTPCGFCFVEYSRRSDALNSVFFLNGAKLDGRKIRIDLDPGFEEGRQFGRGVDGGQRRDDFRQDYDYDRGGYGTFAKKRKTLSPAGPRSRSMSRSASPERKTRRRFRDASSDSEEDRRSVQEDQDVIVME